MNTAQGLGLTNERFREIMDYMEDVVRRTTVFSDTHLAHAALNRNEAPKCAQPDRHAPDCECATL